MAKAMREQGYSTAKIQREVLKFLGADKEYKRNVAENTKAYKHEIKKIIDETVTEAAKAGDVLVGSAGDMAWNDDLRVWKAHNVDLTKPNNLDNLYDAFKLQTQNQLRNLTKTTGFKGTLLGTTGVLNMYQRSMDLAILKLSTGTFSYDQVVKDLIHELAQSGLRSIDYASGRSYHIDTAARMVVRTAASQLAGKITEMNINKTGVELVYVDAHVGARPSHAEWQGQVYSYNGNSRKYKDFYNATDYGDVNGLKGVNCTHNFYPYWEGDVIPEFKEPDPVTANGKEYTYYEATQEQRKQERAIRATKREIEARKAVGADYSDLSAKLRAQNQKYKEFSAQVGIKAQNNRLNIEKVTTGTVSGKSLSKPESMSRARTIKDEATLKQVTKSSIINMQSFDEIKEYFKQYDIELVGFDGKNIFNVKTVMSGVDDALALMPEAKAFIKSIEYKSKMRDMGRMSELGEMFIGPSGLKDYGTGAHETAHAYDYAVSTAHNMHSTDILEQARKNLGLRKNSKEYRNLRMMLAGRIDDIEKDYEMLAYGVETSLSGISNKLGDEIVRIIRSEHE